jgi:uncharacterized protein YodC (DUF2158 family)
MTDFAIGEVVKLKSGGHEMTVQEITEDGAPSVFGRRGSESGLNHFIQLCSSCETRR